MRGLLAILLAALFLTVGPIIDRLAWAQQMPCAPVAQMLPGLEARFGEKSLVTDATGSGGKLTLTANLATGTWTILILSPDGQVACIAANGDGFAVSDPAKPGDPA
jgi:hypothetical protein